MDVSKLKKKKIKKKKIKVEHLLPQSKNGSLNQRNYARKKR